MILLITGGRVSSPFLSKYLKGDFGEIDAIVAADHGLKALEALGVEPDYLIGDFDSYDGDKNKLHAAREIKSLVPEKDDTDTEAAITWILSLQKEGKLPEAAQIHIVGATGTRLDHVLGNISILEKGNILICDENNRIRMLQAPARFTLEKSSQYGEYVSIIPWGGQVKDLTLKGFKYPLEAATLDCFTSLGVSNEIVGKTAEISFTSGYIVLLETLD